MSPSQILRATLGHRRGVRDRCVLLAPRVRAPPGWCHRDARARMWIAGPFHRLPAISYITDYTKETWFGDPGQGERFRSPAAPRIAVRAAAAARAGERRRDRDPAWPDPTVRCSRRQFRCSE